MSKSTKKSNNNYFIVVYYDLLKQLGSNLTDYCVLERLLFRSRHNEYTAGITKIAEDLHKSRGTIYSSVHRLHKLGLLENEDRSYILDANVIDLFNDAKKSTSQYCLLFPHHAGELGLSSIEYCLLYVYYSLSKKSKSAFAYVSYYLKFLNLKERNYYRVRDSLIEKNFITNLGSNRILVSQEISEWFKDNVQN